MLDYMVYADLQLARDSGPVAGAPRPGDCHSLVELRYGPEDLTDQRCVGVSLTEAPGLSARFILALRLAWQHRLHRATGSPP